MSIYAIQAECDNFLADIDKAIESQLNYEDSPFESALEESLAESVSSISEEFSKKLERSIKISMQLIERKTIMLQ